MDKIIIRFYDNEDYDYPLLEINEEDRDKIQKELFKYQQEDTYNYDDFILLLEEKGYIIRNINPNEDWFF
jgi:hypothetical protein